MTTLGANQPQPISIDSADILACHYCGNYTGDNGGLYVNRLGQDVCRNLIGCVYNRVENGEIDEGRAAAILGAVYVWVARKGWVLVETD